MKQLNNSYIFAIVICGFILYYLSPILTPFLLGALLAYVTQPLTKRLDTLGFPHVLSVISIFLGMIIFLILLLLLLVPFIYTQTSIFIDNIPNMVAWFQDTLLPKISEYVNLSFLKTTITDNSAKSLGLITGILHSGHTFIEWTINIILTPIVMFYLLLDWDQIVDKIKGFLPQGNKKHIIKFATEANDVLGVFLRGQLIIMLFLCFFYGLGLSLIGLKGGFIIGIIGGILSIIPYFGSIFVLIASIVAALVQYGTLNELLWVLAIYSIGHIIEGYILTPYLIGNRLGLHPVVVIFAIMAGGTLFGFFGVLLALPVSAVMVVFYRYRQILNIS